MILVLWLFIVVAIVSLATFLWAYLNSEDRD